MKLNASNDVKVLRHLGKFRAARAMVIRRRDAEAGADADAETQITIDFEAEGSSTDAYQKQFGSIVKQNCHKYVA